MERQPQQRMSAISYRRMLNDNIARRKYIDTNQKHFYDNLPRIKIEEET